MTLILYGIPNCDTVKKARNWLTANGVTYEFHDYKKAGIDAARLKAWSEKLGWEKVLNRASSTFKGLAEEAKQGLDETKAITLMMAQPSMIKRPIFEKDGQVIAGLKPDSAELKALLI
ncbi:MAG: arsenate reductase [Asticcacaulis sp.]|nr:arsenate reductase [Asticcacaulis sp.]